MMNNKKLFVRDLKWQLQTRSILFLYGINQRHPDVYDVHGFHDAHEFHDAHDSHDSHDSHGVHALPFHPCLFDQLFSPGLSCPSAKQ